MSLTRRDSKAKPIRTGVVRSLLVLAAAAAMPALPAFGQGACPGTPSVMGRTARVLSTAACSGATQITMAGPLGLFIFQPGGGCNCGSSFGTPPTSTYQYAAQGGGSCQVSLMIRFATTGQNITANGCDWNCGGNTCTMRGGDALPVELMEFSVEPQGRLDDPGDPGQRGRAQRDSVDLPDRAHRLAADGA